MERETINFDMPIKIDNICHKCGDITYDNLSQITNMDFPQFEMKPICLRCKEKHLEYIKKKYSKKEY